MVTCEIELTVKKDTVIIYSTGPEITESTKPKVVCKAVLAGLKQAYEEAVSVISLQIV